jgi:glycosyltransferase involved in cell wall biosynthesis
MYEEKNEYRAWIGRSSKHVLARWLSKWIEKLTVPRATGLISVSPNYLQVMLQRYRQAKPVWVAPERNAVIPFGVLPHDFEVVGPVLQSHRCKKKIIYVGVGGGVMSRSFSLLCRALSQLRQKASTSIDDARIHIYGTMPDWHDGDIKPLENIAKDHNVDDAVCEAPRRVTYRRSIELLLNGDGALILGADDAAYMPSKLFGYALSGKPLLAVLHKKSPAYAMFQRHPLFGHVLWFDDFEEISLASACDVLGAFFKEVKNGQTFDRRILVEPYLATTMSVRHASFFDSCVTTAGSETGFTSA